MTSSNSPLLARSGRRVEAAAKLSLISNIFLVVVKIAAGVASGSISVLAEGIQSTMDVVASALILLTVRAASQPPDESHPYGHGKFENIASLAQMVLILGSAGFLLSAAWGRWHHPLMPRLDWGAGALGVSAVANLLVSGRLMKVAREEQSQALQAEATHLRSDLLSCLGILLGLGVVGLTHNARLDPLIAALMTVIVVVAALKVLRDTLRPLLDESLPQEEERRVREVLESDERVLGFHRLRTRRAGSHRLMDVHVLLDDDLSLLDAHEMTEEVEAKIRSVLPNVDVIVHAEPYEAEMRHQRERHGVEVQTAGRSDG